MNHNNDKKKGTGVQGTGRTLTLMLDPVPVRSFSHEKLSSVVDIDVETIKMTNYSDTVKKLDAFYNQVKKQILRYQSATTGLFPKHSSENVAHIQDTLYCSICVWALYQSYRRIDDDRGKTYELGQSVVKSMRGILFGWMRQSQAKMEAFKSKQCPEFALHSVFDAKTGKPILADKDYGHLQLNNTALYLLYIVQMISSGLQIIYTMDEVNFLQNLVYYVERAYRTPDFGIWERGSKYNNGTPEIHASSIGMAKAALEAINGFNVFGDKGAERSVIYVDIDAHNRNRTIFETLLPRESSSKNTDISLLLATSFPCFATHDEYLYSRTKDKIIRRLEGPYGFKRFLRDGYGCVLEDPAKKFYDQGETKLFDHIECEWPLGYILLILDGIFKNNEEQVNRYCELLEKRIIRDEDNLVVIPKYYYVLATLLDLEKEHPGQSHRAASKEGTPENLFLAGQAFYIISQLLITKMLHINELDPIRRYLPSFNRPRRTDRYSAFQGKACADLVVQVVLIAESQRLQAMMATYGIQTQTPHEVEPVQIWSPTELVKVYEHLGFNQKLGLKGRPPRPIGALGTSKLYKIKGNTVMCYPLIFEVSDFYLSYDMALLIDDIKNELHFVGKYWRMSGRPTMAILIREENMRDSHFRQLLELLAMLKSGNCYGLKVRLGRLQNLMNSACIEHLDFLDLVPDELAPKLQCLQQFENPHTGYTSLTDIPTVLEYDEPLKNYSEYTKRSTEEIVEALRHVDTLYGQSQLLGVLWQRCGVHYNIDGANLEDRMERLTRQAGALRHWTVLRYCSSLLGKLADSLSPYITSILVSGKQLTVGVFGKSEYVIDHPLTPQQVQQLIYSQCLDYPYHAVLMQEILVYCGKLIQTTPKLFNGILKIRVGWMIHALQLYMKFSDNKQALESLSPSELRRVVLKVLDVKDSNFTQHQIRQIEGALCRVPDYFFDRVWDILTRVPDGIVICGQHLPQQPTLSELTVYELSFALKIELLLSRVSFPEYRHLMVELLMVIDVILRRNHEFSFTARVDLDELIREAFALFQMDRGTPPGEAQLQGSPRRRKSREEMSAFYAVSNSVSTCYLSRAVVSKLLSADCAKKEADVMNHCHMQ
ncbi:probable phosphorylase b kinase regulatory subunit beta isoform X2 [Varroa jacobsoni]|uniref:probable phosphorylase b kinase regulatory subunit beta isoform X2 n=1 Tax=Varroa jacobsoni TaxID=62625 RepID=UPI000BF5EBB5|nr:probable phosphorylase b kinase regulatory subunit beta isoform X2 [Varroa jacobsoni]